VYVLGEAQAANGPLSRLHWKVAGSEAVNSKVAEVEPVVPEGPEVIVVSGGVVSSTVNDDELVPVPPAVVTEIGPVVAPLGTVAWISDAEMNVQLAGVPLNFTEIGEVKFEPRMSMLVPTGPLVGVNEVIVGGSAMTVKEDELQS